MIALVLYLGLSLVLVVSHGHFGVGPVVMVLGAGLLLVGIGRDQDKGRRLDAPVVLGCSLANLAILTAGNQMIYAREVEPLKGLRTVLIVTVFTIVAAILVSTNKALVERWPKAKLAGPALVVVALGAMFVGKALVIRASPAPFIDVWTSSVAAVDHLLAGRNPYTQQYADIYAGAYAYKPGMPYGPAFLLWSALWAGLFGGQHDVRVGLTIAEALLSITLGVLTFRRTRDLVLAGAVALVWVTNPIGLFVLEQSWVDPVLMLALGLCVLALQERRLALAGVALGFAFAVKTYAIVGVGLIGLWVLRAEGLAGARRFVIASAATAAAFILPFVVMDASAFWNSMFGLWADQAPRADAITLVALRAEIEGLQGQGHEVLRPLYGPFNVLTLALVAASAAWTYLRAGRSLARLGWALGAVHVWFFLFARQAFCNYYYYALGFLVIALACWPARPAPAAAASPGPVTA